MSSPAATAGKSPTDVIHTLQWWASEEYSEALARWQQRMYPTKLDYMYAPSEEFTASQEFRDARHAFRKRINHSWNKEST